MAQIKSLFRNQLVLDNQRDLFDYWQSKCNDNSLPQRSDICPSELSNFLTTISLIDVHDNNEVREYSYRLAGTGLHIHFRQEITGKSLSEAFPAHVSSYWHRVLEGLVERKNPSCGAVRACRSAGHEIQFWMRLPLVNAKGRVNMILSYDIFTSLSALSEGSLNRVAIL